MLKKKIICIGLIIIAMAIMLAGCSTDIKTDDESTPFNDKFWSEETGSYVVDYTVESASGGLIGKNMIKKYCELSVEIEFIGEGKYALRYFMNSRKMSGLALKQVDVMVHFVESEDSIDTRVIYEVELDIDNSNHIIEFATHVPAMNMDVSFTVLLDLKNARAI